MKPSELLDLVCHTHGVDLPKITREWDPRWAIEREQAAGVALGPFHRQYLLDRAPESLRRSIDAMRSRTVEVFASAQGFNSLEMPISPGNLRAAINTTVTETNLWNPAKFASLPIGSLQAGKGFFGRFGGVMGTTGTPTLAARMRVGTNNSAPPTGVDHGIGPTTTLEGITAQPWYGQFDLGCRTTDLEAATCTTTGNGFILVPGAAASAASDRVLFGGLVATTVDPTAAQGVSVSVIWGASSASNTITPQWLKFGSDN